MCPQAEEKDHRSYGASASPAYPEQVEHTSTGAIDQIKPAKYHRSYGEQNRVMEVITSLEL